MALKAPRCARVTASVTHRSIEARERAARKLRANSSSRMAMRLKWPGKHGKRLQAADGALAAESLSSLSLNLEPNARGVALRLAS